MKAENKTKNNENKNLFFSVKQIWKVRLDQQNKSFQPQKYFYIL